MRLREGGYDVTVVKDWSRRVDVDYERGISLASSGNVTEKKTKANAMEAGLRGEKTEQ